MSNDNYIPPRVADKPERQMPETEPRKNQGWTSNRRAPINWTGPLTRILVIGFGLAVMFGIGYFVYSVVESYAST